MNIEERTITNNDDNIAQLRTKYPNGLHFIVGDLHGEGATLMLLMEKIHFNPQKDHVFFVGDYNAGGDIVSLIEYMSKYYQADYNIPGFHMIRGNHERELWPLYYLENLPDIIVYRGKNLNYYIVHAGMVSSAFDLINSDMDKEPDQKVFAYSLDVNTCCYDAPLRQVVWSLRGLYSQYSRRHVWPTEEKLKERRACIVHGHSPYCYFKKNDRYTYGDNNLFWEKQHVWFSEELQSFNIDSNVKGKYVNGETYRGLSCLCMEVYDELASTGDGILTVEKLRNAENGIFGQELCRSWKEVTAGNPDIILKATPKMKTISLDGEGNPCFL